MYGEGSGTIVFNNLVCQGTETSLEECKHNLLNTHDCGHNKDVGVICTIPGQLTARLYGGKPWAGLLLIFDKGSWKSVCDDEFGKEDAQVACRMLGFNSPEAVAVGSALYGEGQGEILLDDVTCLGTETSLAQCQHRGYGKHDCGHSEDVGLICEINANHLRLVGSGRVRYDMGRVQFLLETDWTTPCVSHFSNSAAKVLCRQLNFPSKTATMVTASSFGSSQGRYLNVNFTCTGGESSILGCLHTMYTFASTCSGNEVGIICSNSNSTLYIVLDTNLTGTNYPLWEGTGVKLKCRNTQQSQSGVVYTWTETAGGRSSGQYLTFVNVTRAHHGGRARCRASLGSGRWTLTSDTLEIKVYYRPAIRITWDVNACENLEVNTNQCVIEPKQNVTFWCNADSNPRPASTVWSGKMSANTGRLQITATDNAKHSGQYTCTVTTETESGDSRLPLTSSHTFNIAVKHPSRVVRFQINGESGATVTVAENSTVRMLCEADGRPTPYMVLVSGPNNHQPLASRPRGNPSLSQQTAELSYVMTRAPCDASGDYRCDVTSEITAGRRRIRLVIRCPPRRKDPKETLPSLDIHDNKGLLVFEMTAYPEPYVKDTIFIGPVFTEDIKGTLAKNKLQVDCISSSFAPASVTCNITAFNMTRDDEGFYQIVFSNSLGHLPFVFRVRISNKGHGFTLSSILIIIGAAVGGVVVLVAVVVCRVTWCKGKTKQPSEEDKNVGQVLETRVSFKDMKATWLPNVFQQVSCPAATGPRNEERGGADHTNFNTAEHVEESEDLEHEYTNVYDLLKRFKRLKKQ